ncbi:PEPxxWA-CTERM sorting domain-containing protein [Phenylobacterium sp. LH3H17]|uniref:PEPxxWA-CTERM sorting domain-containing protein n=1 Tax=Phenylobacterium sp. LH3H17 TaxID=2903901 RepID=UPI0020C9BCA3|nr:PEPxxWA-CTERM sorting domain-containing protein [Phenylobacterium sp. LH3H17]UTP38047.1 PEPxxWA-CTERM sorting domain-containing protein [Phenylobacterium sp. LH3H17]
MRTLLAAGAAIICLAAAQGASATTFTTISPTGGALPSGVTQVGGVVLDLKGLNGTRVVTQAAASSLFVGYASTNPQVFGSQSGFSPAVVASLGGGLAGASLRVSLYDGDTAPGDFDFNQITLLVDGASFGDWSAVATQQTSNDGLTLYSSGTGFGDNILSTGWFSLSDSTQLGNLFAGLGDGSLDFRLDDNSWGDNFYDFTQGVDGGLVDVGTGPIITPGGVPEPATWAMMIMGFGGVGSMLRANRRRQALVLA